MYLKNIVSEFCPKCFLPLAKCLFVDSQDNHVLPEMEVILMPLKALSTS